MKKKILLGLAVLCLLSSMLVFASCGDEHACVFNETTYDYDDEGHWLKCVATDGEGCSRVSGEEAHTFEVASRREPTCEVDGELVEACKCGKTRTTVLEAGHSVVEKVTAPSCEAEGYTELTCAVEGCTYYEKVDIVEPSHEFEDSIVPPTCTDAGYTEVKCKLCGYVKETKDTVSKVGHSFVDRVIMPTCTEEGYTERVCITCGLSEGKSNYVNALDHDYQYKTVEPSCVIGGSTRVTCSRCNYREDRDKVEALGHIYYTEADAKEHVHYKVVLAPTCEEEGEIKYKCTRCSQVSSEATGTLPALGHIEIETVIPPICDQIGVTEVSCERCEKYLRNVEGSEVEAIGHKYEMELGYAEEEGKHFVITLAPTCTEKGTKAYKCQREECQRVAEVAKNPEAIVELPENGHTWVVSVNAWCGNGGNTEYVCDVCDAIDSIKDETKEYWHSFPADGVAVIEPTCVAFGEYICSYVNEHGTACNQYFVARQGDEMGQPTGNHEYDIFIEMVASNCIRQGYTVYGCSAGECGTTVRDDYMPYEAHDIGEVSELGFAICENCGSSFIDITAEEIVETEKICMGCGSDPCTCETVGEITGYIKPSAPFEIVGGTPLEITGVELSTGWQDLSIGYGLIILNSESNASFTVTVYSVDGTEKVFEKWGANVVVDLYEVGSVTRVVITSPEDATVSLYRPF